MGAVKNAFHGEICDRADTERLREDGYSDAEITEFRDSDRNPKGEKPQALSAEHESAGLNEASPEPIRETPNATR